MFFELGGDWCTRRVMISSVVWKATDRARVCWNSLSQVQIGYLKRTEIRVVNETRIARRRLAVRLFGRRRALPRAAARRFFETLPTKDPQCLFFFFSSEATRARLPKKGCSHGTHAQKTPRPSRSYARCERHRPARHGARAVLRARLRVAAAPSRRPT